MAEYIDREAAQKQFDKELYMTESERAYTKSVIRKVQAADVAPVVHGRWDGNKCTSCGGKMCCEVDAEQFDLDCVGYNYCPNCGAKMDGGMSNG